MGPTPVAICIVTHNSQGDLPGCLAAIGALSYRPLELVVVDCASADDSVATAREHCPAGVSLTYRALSENVGFAGGMNEALSQTDAPLVLTLNPDARPEPDYLSRLLEQCLSKDPSQRPATLVLSGGNIYVVGTDAGAASLFRREALDDVAVDGEIFLAEFHSFREDAELCFRLRERGWEVLYEPSALCEHRRRSLPSTRRQMPPHVNMHSLKNRYLLRFYHQNGVNLLLTGVPALARDLAALAYVLVRERSSLEAYRWLWQERSEILRRRSVIRSRRTVDDSVIDRWFFRQSLPL